jgi:hypothetical protein
VDFHGLQGQEKIQILLSRFREVRALERAKYGALSSELREKFVSANEDVQFKVLVTLKYPEGIKHPSKFEKTLEELDAYSKQLITLQPVQSLDYVFENYGFGHPVKLDQWNAIHDLTKSQLRKLMFDNNVVSITEYVEPTPLSRSTIKSISILPALIGQSGHPHLSCLSQSAYFHSSSGTIPSNAAAGVKASTFENGITPSVLSCWMSSGTNVTSSANLDAGGDYHSDATFLAMTYAAPGASYYHHISSTYVGQSSYIISSRIQTSSMSYANTQPYNSQQFREMDDFAFKSPYTVFCNPTANSGSGLQANWLPYNAISVGNVRHRDMATFEVGGPTCADQCTQTRNPPAVNATFLCLTRTGSPISCAGDREMPYVVAPGYTPNPGDNTDPLHPLGCGGGIGEMDLPCRSETHHCGTSFSAPTANGIAADIIAADGRMYAWPEKVRATMILTAQNVMAGEWDASIDGEDGAGVISGANAVDFAKNHYVASVSGTATIRGMAVNLVNAGNWSTPLTYNIQIPNSVPSDKNLRIVLTWDSNPSLTLAYNDLSDLDLSAVTSTSSVYSSASYEGNVEVITIPGNTLVANSVTVATINKWVNRIQSWSTTNYFYYAIAWDWVDNHAP